jgi:sialic acid synthase SpsE
MKRFLINKKNIIKKRYIIAEIGINHEGSIKKAIELIKSAKKAGADAVKFQAFKSETLASIDSKKSDQQKKSTYKNENLYKMWKRMEFNIFHFKKIKKVCKKIKIDFLSSVFDEESYNMLLRIDVDAYKIASSDITDFKLLKLISKTKKPIILSTGMANLKEIKNALNILKKNNVFILHCVSLYPCAKSKVNLLRLIKLKKILKRPIGFSDHSKGIEASLAALTLGANIIEKHFTYDKKKLGSDHSISANYTDMRNICAFADNINQMLGNGKITPSNPELKHKLLFRKSLFYKKSIKKNKKISVNDITVKRPLTGIPANFYFKVNNKFLNKDVKKNNPIFVKDLKNFNG